MPYFPRFPFFNNFCHSYPYPYKSLPCNTTNISKNIPTTNNITNYKDTKNSSKNNENYFFELFGLKLYFDDVLLICLIFFLYQEGVKDEELFISLILLLLS